MFITELKLHCFVSQEHLGECIVITRPRATLHACDK